MEIRDAYITNVAVFFPGDPVSNDEMEKVLGSIGDRASRARTLVLKNNGIKNRYYSWNRKTGKLDYTNAQMTANAIKNLENSNFKLSDMECLICGTTLPDQMMPNHAVMVHGELQLQPIEVVATSGICLAGITAMKYAYQNVITGHVDSAVSTGSEVASMIMRAENFKAESDQKIKELEKRNIIAFEKDFLRWMLSDGAGAVVIQNKPSSKGISLKIEWMEILSFAGEIDACMYGGSEKLEDGSLRGWAQMSQQEWLEKSVFSLKQDVELLNNSIVSLTVEKALQIIMKRRQITADQIDYFLPHYSSDYFREKLMEGMVKIGFEIPYSKWFTNLTTKGNTGSASIYIILEEIFHSGKLKKGEKLLLFIPESGRFSAGYVMLSVV